MGCSTFERIEGAFQQNFTLLNLIGILGAGGKGACSRLPQQKEAKGSLYCQLNDVGDELFVQVFCVNKAQGPQTQHVKVNSNVSYLAGSWHFVIFHLQSE